MVAGGETVSETFRPIVQQKRPRIRLDKEAYAELRREVLHRDDWRCVRCGIGVGVHGLGDGACGVGGVW